MQPQAQSPGPLVSRQNCPGRDIAGSPCHGYGTGGKERKERRERSGRSVGRLSQVRVPSGELVVRSSHVLRSRRRRERRSLKWSSRGRHDVSGWSRGCTEGPNVGARWRAVSGPSAPRLLPHTGVAIYGPMKSPCCSISTLPSDQGMTLNGRRRLSYGPFHMRTPN